jgi:hypothetical protein
MPLQELKAYGRSPLLVGVPMPTSISEIDLSGLVWATPFDVAALAAMWCYQEAVGHTPTLVLPTDPLVRAYLVDMGLAGFIPGDWGSGGGSKIEAPWLPLTRVHSADQWDDLQNVIWPIARAKLGTYELAQRTLDILGELVDNAATHGRSDVGTFVCAQRYGGTTSGLPPGVWLGITDAGVGIPAHLRRNPKYTQIRADTDLIRLARHPWVTGTADRRGWGLVDVFEKAAEAGLSRVLIRSGGAQGAFWLRPGRRPSARYRACTPPTQGTWIHVLVEGA